MEIKTKFDIGQTVWYVDYKKNNLDYYPAYGSIDVIDNPPVGVSHGKITGFHIGSGDAQWFVGKQTDAQHFVVDEKYTISSNINERCVTKTADHIYATQAEAEQALRIAEHEYHIDKMDELSAVKALLDELTKRAEENGIIPKVVGVDEGAIVQEVLHCPYCGEEFVQTYVKGSSYTAICPKCNKIAKAVSIIKGGL